MVVVQQRWQKLVMVTGLAKMAEASNGGKHHCMVAGLQEKCSW